MIVKYINDLNKEARIQEEKKWFVLTGVERRPSCWGRPIYGRSLPMEGILDKGPSVSSRTINTFRHSFAYIHRLILLFVYNIKAKRTQVQENLFCKTC